MTKTLEERIEERKKQAEDRMISFKAEQVATRLGQGGAYGGMMYAGSSKKYHFARGELAIGFNSYNPDNEGSDIRTVTITYKGGIVYHHESVIESYIPGEWEEQLNKLYATPKPVPVISSEEKERMKLEFEKQQREKAAKFGL